METAVLTLRVPAELRDRLEALAKATQRSKAFHGAEAIRGSHRRNQQQPEQ